MNAIATAALILVGLPIVVLLYVTSWLLLSLARDEWDNR